MVELIHERAGEKVVVLDIRRINPVIGDFFIIATGFTTDHLLDMAEHVGERFGGLIEGSELSSWVVVDMGDIIVHLFLPDARSFYSLEDLYGDAPVLYSETEEVV
ncbi:MAG: ribosome silencing factor [Thermotogae bacterium]|nr:ribosome silencing factor [Thermotogota bacterium]